MRFSEGVLRFFIEQVYFDTKFVCKVKCIYYQTIVMYNPYIRFHERKDLATSIRSLFLETYTKRAFN